MNKKIMIAAGIVGVIIVVSLGVYFYSSKKTNDSYIDLNKGQENTCNISDTQQNVLLAYTKGEYTYIGVMHTNDTEVIGTCELPFENNENIYMAQNQNGNLYVYNDASEVFQFNGSHFTKIPSNLYSGNTNVNVTTEGSNVTFALHFGSVKIDKTYTYPSEYTLKNAYVYANIKDMDTLNLYELSDPGSEISNSFITVRVKADDTVYYVIYDVESKTLLRVISNPFDTVDGAFYASVEDDKYLLFAGSQTYDINANEIIEHDAATIDEAAVSVEFGMYSEENPADAVKMKSSNSDVKPYILQSIYPIDYAYIVMK